MKTPLFNEDLFIQINKNRIKNDFVDDEGYFNIKLNNNVINKLENLFVNVILKSTN